MNVRHLSAGAILVLALTLTGCTGSDEDVAPTGDDTTATETAAPSQGASPTDDGAEAEPTSPEEDGSPTDDWDDAPELVDPDLADGVVGSWTTPDGSEIVIASEAAEGEGTPAAYFNEHYGSLGPGDGVDVQRVDGTTDADAAFLVVFVTPAPGFSGNSEARFVVFEGDTQIVGSLAAPGDISDADRNAFLSLAESGGRP